MRKQYHFKPSPKGFLAWDVDKLVMLSRDFPVIDVPLSHICELDANHWFNLSSVPTCRKIAEHALLIREVELRYPIILFSDGSVADGMHRVCRALMDNLPTIKAVQFTADPEPDYVGKKPEQLPY